MTHSIIKYATYFLDAVETSHDTLPDLLQNHVQASGSRRRRSDPSYSRKLVTGRSGGVLSLLDSVFERQSLDKVGEVCRHIGMSEQSYYRWRREYGGLELDQARRLKDLD
jgi:hypothetical protein